ncbi:hypothetical protein V5799_015273 [Amblyomma americanum]|uniref:Condensin complex subunit 2 n=1 Tax=Amblyomma americanum TaxID=6943 RepID=A0AAQ4E0M4_AMBAM
MPEVKMTTPRRQTRNARASFYGDSALEEPNDDNAERHSRQQELLQELHAQHMESPGTPGRKRKSVGLGPPTFSDVQLAEHYSNCIRLSNENKITIKNAFHLHLIDLLKKVLEEKDGSTNFQSAGCSLDASAKIYAHRVDHVHSEALHIAGELGVSSKLRKRDLKGNEGDEDNPDQPLATGKTPAKKTKNRSASTLVRNEKTITLDKVETARPADPLQEYIRLHSTTGTSDCFVLNHIHSFSDRAELMFLDIPRAHEGIKDTWTKAPVGFLQRCVKNRNGICPDPRLGYMWSNESVEAERHDFTGTVDTFSKLNASASIAATDEPMVGAPSMCDIDDMDCESAALFDDGDSCLEDEPQDVFKDNLAEITKYLAPVPQDYSYFTDKLPSVPHGPEQWRMRLTGKGKATGPEKGRKRLEKVVPLLDFEKLEPDPSDFVPAKKAPVLEKSTLASWKKSKVLIPYKRNGEDVNMRTLVLLSDRNVPRFVSTQPTETDSEHGDNADDDMGGGFCPDVNEDSNMSIDQGADPGLLNVVDPLPLPEPEPKSVDDVPAAGPVKIPKFQFSFKRFDMKDMKQAMWETMSGDNKENIPSGGSVSEEQQEKEGATSNGPLTFGQVYRRVRPRLNRINRESLNIPVAFVALLHLAVEKEFFVNSIEDFSDLEIVLPK